MYENKKILILGAAKSGIAVAKLLANKNNDIILTDLNELNKDIENELNDMSIDRKNEFEKIAEGFLKERCIFSHDYEVRVDNSSIKKSEPEKSIRIMRAIMEAID